MTAKLYCQGDLMLRPVSKIKKGKKIPAVNGRLILALGEVTGHSHTIDAEVGELFLTEADEMFLSTVGAVLEHQEHGAITLPPGDYEVIRQREYTPEAPRMVAD